MSIPNAFRPVCAKRPDIGYVTDGLVFWIDTLLAGDGQDVVLRDLVSGRALPGSATISGGIGMSPFRLAEDGFLSKNSEYTQEIVCARPSSSRTLLGFAAVRRDPPPLYSPICGEGADYDIYVGNETSFGGWRMDSPGGADKKLKTLHFPKTYSPNIYINGTPYTMTQYHGGAAAGESTLLYLVDYYCAVRVYNRTLTDEEIMRNAMCDAARYDMTHDLY